MTALRDLVAEELRLPVDRHIREIAKAIAHSHQPGSRAVLFYGSCLREKQLSGRVLDFYLIVSSYRAAYRKGWLALANQLVPPNVFYLEHAGFSAKYAVLSEADFHRLNGPKTNNVSVWGRFAQPSRLAWAKDKRAAESAIDAVARAAPTLLSAAGVRNCEPSLDDWRRAFELSYSAELRAERLGRGASVVDLDPQRYSRFGSAAASEAASLRRRGHWPLRRLGGKCLSVLRLAKAAFTFAGGADYIAWKINRHAGLELQLRPWQRRHPLIAGLTLLPRLLRSGAVR